MAVASLSKSTQHLLESLVLGTDAPGTQVYAGTITATIPTAAAGAVGSVTATVTGAALGDIVIVSGPTVTLAGGGAVSASVTNTNTVTLTSGSTAGYTGASKVYNYVLFKQS